MSSNPHTPVDDPGSVQVAIDRRRAFACATISGPLAPAAVHRSVDALLAAPRFRSEMNLLFDLRHVDLSELSGPDLQQLAETASVHLKTLTPARVAAVVSSDADYRRARAYQAYSARLPRQFEPFQSVDDAVGWLCERMPGVVAGHTRGVASIRRARHHHREGLQTPPSADMQQQEEVGPSVDHDARPSTHVLVAAGDWIVRRAVENRLEQAGYSVKGVASFQDALTAVEIWRPDVALVDIELADGKLGIDLARQLWNRFAVSVVYVTAGSVEEILAADMPPAAFVVTKPFQESQLLSAVVIAAHQVRARRADLASKEHGGRGLEDTSEHQWTQTARTGANAGTLMWRLLSPRERDIARHLLSNGRVVTIAAELEISPYTVRNHLGSIYRKLGVHSQVELIHTLSSSSAAGGS